MLRAFEDAEKGAEIILPDKPTDAETYAWDSRQYVAYLLADGNGMGEAFNACTPQQASKMSEKVSDITYKALAEASNGLMGVQARPRAEMPLLPLIMGGDDVFALLPANWALDVACRYAENYQEAMTNLWEQEGIKAAIEQNRQANGDDKEAIATLGVAVVICKSSYPYKSAHEFGEALLKQVKDESKALNEPQSMVGISWIVGSTVAKVPFFPAYTLSDAQFLIGQRKKLNDMPSRVREGSRQALDPSLEAEERGERFKTILARYQRNDGEEKANLLRQSHEYLSNDGLYELLNLWDFLLDSTLPEIKYETGEVNDDN